MFRAFNISASALTIQRLRMDIVAQNIANANTTRTENGLPYRRKVVIVQEDQYVKPFSKHLAESNSKFVGSVSKLFKYNQI
jgi:flagellar basal-body rod protein FlgC